MHCCCSYLCFPGLIIVHDEHALQGDPGPHGG
jgi:hypothetical protein